MPSAATGFVPADLDASDFDQIQPLLGALLDRPVDDAEGFGRWLADRSDLESACSEARATLYIDMTCRTGDERAQRAYTRFIEQVAPRIKPLAFDLDRRHVELAERFGDAGGRYLVLNRDTTAEVELFREQNIPLQTELDRLSQKYDQICGAMTVEYDGQERTLPQMTLYQESTDRAIRESAWRCVARRRLDDADAIDGVFDEMILLRDRVARNAGCKSYIEYAFRSMHRFDYGPDHCRTFHESCERIVVPFLRRLDERRRDLLGVDRLRPWDLLVDARGRQPLRPFHDGVELVAKTRAVLGRLDPGLEAMFASLGDGSNADGASDGACLDLDTRRGKAPGGYQYMRDRSLRPFIFMNAAGLHRDVETMVHEAGHAFHSLLCVDEPLLHYRHSPIEFAEVASMSMELLTMPHWGGPDGFYPDEGDVARARRQQLESSVTLLPWIATIDAFQHWLYANPGHTHEQRTEAWLALDERFGHAVSWEGAEDFRQRLWQRQGHLFGAPFYYIEYGIAQLGALQLWLRSVEEGQDVAIDAYKAALSLGGSRPLPDLFGAAGIRFDFGPEIVTRLVDRVEAELEALPD